MHLLVSGPDVRPTVIRPLTQRDQFIMMFVPELAESPIRSSTGAPGITASDGRGVLHVLDAVVASGRSHQAVALGTPILAEY
jgi:hypothetical protein